jgi:hypothetical protein
LKEGMEKYVIGEQNSVQFELDEKNYLEMTFGSATSRYATFF